MSRMGLGEFFANEAATAISDVRQKLFEEAWFGRVVTAAPVMEVSRDPGGTPGNPAMFSGRSFDELWGRSVDGREQPARDIDRDR